MDSFDCLTYEGMKLNVSDATLGNDTLPFESVLGKRNLSEVQVQLSFDMNMKPNSVEGAIELDKLDKREKNRLDAKRFRYRKRADLKMLYRKIDELAAKVDHLRESVNDHLAANALIALGCCSGHDDCDECIAAAAAKASEPEENDKGASIKDTETQKFLVEYIRNQQQVESIRVAMVNTIEKLGREHSQELTVARERLVVKEDGELIGKSKGAEERRIYTKERNRLHAKKTRVKKKLLEYYSRQLVPALETYVRCMQEYLVDPY